MIPFIGDLSKQDALLLKEFAEKSTAILEFGVGGSTQILRHYSSGTFDSVDTSEAWIEKTKRNLSLLRINKGVSF